MLFTVAICADNREDIQIVLSCLHKYELKQNTSISFSPTSFTNPRALLNCSRKHFDLYILDFFMKEMPGIELARALSAKNSLTQDAGNILFLSSEAERNAPGISVCSCGCLVKPVNFDIFSDKLNQIFKKDTSLSCVTQPKYSFRIVNGFHKTPICDILYVEIMGHTPYYHLKSSVVRGSDLRISFTQSIKPLLDTGSFLLPHRSYAVNAAHVTTLFSKELLLNDGSRIPVSRNRYPGTKTQYMDFLMENERHARC